MASLSGIGEHIKSMPAKKKVVLLLVAALTITSVVLLFAWFQKADYQTLFTNLSEEDAGVIVQRLKELKIPYRVSGGGIAVPSEKVYDLRLQLASQGLPQGGGVGFELFDKTSFSTTDFVQKLNYRRALQGELARTIKALSEVEQCRVHLAFPEKSLFAKEEERPKASVLIKLKPGRTLSQGQVQGIVHLVSSSVEGLNPRDVAIVDSLGQMLTSGGGESPGMTTGQIEYQRNLEKDIENRIVGILEPVVGKNKVRAKVATVLDLTRVEKTEERFDPDGQIVRSEQRNTEKSTSGTTGGVPGVSSNLPGKTSSATALSQGQSEKKNETINYEISRITSRTVNTPGEIKRLSVAVLVDGSYAAQSGSKERQYKPRTEEELKKFEDMVKNAIGFTAERGDEVRVVNMAFDTPPQEEMPEPKREILPIVITVAKYFIPLAALIILALLVIRPLISALGVPQSVQRAPLALPKTVAEIERAMEVKDKPSRDRAIEWAQKNPKEAAHLIKGWIEED